VSLFMSTTTKKSLIDFGESNVILSPGDIEHHNKNSSNIVMSFAKKPHEEYSSDQTLFLEVFSCDAAISFNSDIP